MRGFRKPTSFFATLGIILMLARPASGAGNQEPADPGRESFTESQEWDFWFFTLEEYRLRALDSPWEIYDEQDQDLRLFLQGGVADPADRFGAEISLALWMDIDGSVPGDESSGLASAHDYRQPWWDAYTLSAEYRSRGSLRLFRAGRQASGHGLSVTFDGISVELSGGTPHLVVFAFGGRSAHFFEVAPDRFEDWVASVGAVLRPTKYLRIEADYRFLAEDVLGEYREAQRDVIDHSYGLILRYRLYEWFRVRAYMRGLDDQPSHAGAAARLVWHRLDLGVDAGVDAQTVTLREVSEREDPYYAILGESLPHLRFNVQLWKWFETAVGDYGTHAGFSGRSLLKGREGPFNRNAAKAYLMLEGKDIWVKGLFAIFSVEGHFVLVGLEPSGDLELALGGSLGYADKKLKAEAGTYYQRFKYDYYRVVRELRDVRTIFGSVSYRVFDWLAVKARYEFERLEWDAHTFTLTLNQSY